MFILSESSPTGIAWRSGRMAGKNAGTLQVLSGIKYFVIRLNRKSYLAHRIVYALVEERDLNSFGNIDHIDRNGLNNDPWNLRPSTQQQNCWNTKVKSNSRTGVKGVTLIGTTYVVKIRNKIGKRITLGRFKSLQLASEAYSTASKLMHKEFSIFI